ncbi:hypothetical protein LIER_34377 [Lithospermum erythrorhizon]|uniref:Retrotransposon gag domain-containing protein n=1 Tax=Lithospermum erythrorhizon TaxID=34254 RepID=A0AAV3S049_LITER
MHKDLNLQDRPGVSTRARSTLAPLDTRGELIAPSKGPSKTTRLPRMEPALMVRAHSNTPRPSLGKVTSHSISHHRDKLNKGHRRDKVHTLPGPSAKHDAEGSSNSDLQKQLNELKALLKDITPGQGPVKHSTMLPFLDRLSDDEAYARAFASSLSDQALKWFHKLPPKSIDCWQDAVDLFMDKFGASIVADADERTLMEIQQRAGETLRSYATRFEEVATNIPTANEKVTMISFFHMIEIRDIEGEVSSGTTGNKKRVVKIDHLI